MQVSDKKMAKETQREESTQRKAGWYWVQFERGEWTPMQWSARKLFWTLDGSSISDDDPVEIGQRIPEPEESMQEITGGWLGQPTQNIARQADWEPLPKPPKEERCRCEHGWDQHKMGEIGYECTQCKCSFFMLAEFADVILPKPPWRVGGKVPLNVYEGNTPMFQCHTPEQAQRIVSLLNRPDALAAAPDLLEALKWIGGAGQRENELLRRNSIVFDKWPAFDGRMSGPIVLDGHDDTDLSKCTPEERWQALAFTLHTNLWEIAEKAEWALAELREAIDRAMEGA